MSVAFWKSCESDLEWTTLINSDVFVARRHFLETSPDLIAMVIRVELFIHKLCQTDATCNIVMRE